MKRKIIFLLATSGILLALYWVYSHTFIEITVANPSNGEISYELTDQGSKESNITKTKSSQIKKLVAKSTNEITVKQAGKSYFAVVETKGFLRSVVLKAKLAPEKSRTFVGNNPESCMDYFGGILISFECFGLFRDAKIHKPATPSLPTYTIDNPNIGVFGYVRGVVYTKEGKFILINAPTQTNEGTASIPSNALYRLDDSLATSDPVNLTGLDGNTAYSIRQYRDGFVVYDSSFSQIFYFSSPESKPVSISIDKPREKNLRPVALSTLNNDILTLYTNRGTKEARSEVISKKDNQSSMHFVFNKSYTSARFCGTQKLCLLDASSKILNVYDIGSEKAKLLYRLVDVVATANSAKGFLVVNKTGVLNFNVEDRNGYYEYSFGDYKFGGLQKVESGYILRLTNNKNGVIALLIDQTSANSDGIDKKVANLQKLSQVSFVSIYGNYIYISAELGPLVYSDELRSYTYNPVIKKAAAVKINSEITRLGISRAVYSISSNAF